MASRHELALRVEERTTGAFFWTLMEACEMQGSDVFHYRALRSAPVPQAAYWDAMVLGMAELRRTLAGHPVEDVERQA